MAAADTFGIRADHIHLLPTLAWHRDVALWSTLPQGLLDVCGVCKEEKLQGLDAPAAMRIVWRYKPDSPIRSVDVCGPECADDQLTELLDQRQLYPMPILGIHVPKSWALQQQGRAA